MPVKLLHLADLHLDRPFVGLALEQARERRRGLRGALERGLALGAERQVDLITIGGDLWEHEHVLPDTCRWVADRFGAAGVPVVLVAGNHDPLMPGGPYERVAWPENVHVLSAGPLQEHRLPELSVWGVSWGSEPLSATFLEDFVVPADGRSHCLLLHGTVAPGAGRDGAHCPFTAAAVNRAGFDLCLAGHLHGGGVRERLVVYPGSPEPLAWDETGRHACALIELAPGAAPQIELIDLNRTRNAQLRVDCQGATSSAELQRALSTAIERLALSEQAVASECSEPSIARAVEGLCVRAVLKGRIAPDCRLDLEDLRRSVEGSLGFIELHDQTTRAFDLQMLGAQPSAIGRFVSELRSQIEECGPDQRDRRARLELALELGLRAMHGDDLELAADTGGLELVGT